MPEPFETSAQRFRRIHGKPDPRTANPRQRADDPVQREADRLRSTARWQRVRATILVADSGLCRACVGAGRALPALATEVDHIVPLQVLIIRGEAARAFDPSNLQPLCAACHDIKSAQDRVRYGPVVAAARTRPSPRSNRSTPGASSSPSAPGEGVVSELDRPLERALGVARNLPFESIRGHRGV